jgi:hypothetical protein
MHNMHTLSAVHAAPDSMDTEACLGAKRPRREAYYSPSSNAQVNDR